MMHLGDLDRSSEPGNRDRWDATVIITVHDARETAVAGATLRGSWSGRMAGGGSCLTDGKGQCSISKSNPKSKVSSVTLTVTDVRHGSYTCEWSGIPDPDPDCDGTRITVNRPL